LYTKGILKASPSKFELLVDAYALGDVLIDQDVQAGVTDMIAKGLLLSKLPTTEMRVLLFNKTAESPHLHGLLVRLVADTGTCDECTTADDDPRYLAMLVRVMQDKTEETTAMAVAARVRFHQGGNHNEDAMGQVMPSSRTHIRLGV
jgi:hypothetical protein